MLKIVYLPLNELLIIPKISFSEVKKKKRKKKKKKNTLVEPDRHFYIDYVNTFFFFFFCVTHQKIEAVKDNC